MCENKKNQQPTKKPVNQQKKSVSNKKSTSNDDFKRRYFDFYDDIKISDRQDW